MLLDKESIASQTIKQTEEPRDNYENVPQYHLKAIKAGMEDLEAGRMIAGADFRKTMRKKYGL